MNIYIGGEQYLNVWDRAACHLIYFENEDGTYREWKNIFIGSDKYLRNATFDDVLEILKEFKDRGL